MRIHSVSITKTLKVICLTIPCLCAPLFISGRDSFSTYELSQFSLGEQMKNLQKRELHLHLGGAWPLNYLKEISEPDQFSDLCLMLDQIQDGAVDYHGAFRVFGLISKIMHSDERVENGIVALCNDLLSDNVVYAEFRTGVKDLGSGLDGYVATVLRGIQRGTARTPLKVGLILSLRRDTSSFIAEQTIDLALKYRHEGVIGIDVFGDSTQGDGQHIFPALIRAKKTTCRLRCISENPKKKRLNSK